MYWTCKSAENPVLFKLNWLLGFALFPSSFPYNTIFESAGEKFRHSGGSISRELVFKKNPFSQIMREKVTTLGGMWQDLAPIGARDWKERVKGANRQCGDLRREEQGYGGQIENSESRDRGKLSSGREDTEGVGQWYRGEETDCVTEALRR